MTDDQRRLFLKDEYLFLQNQYEDYDKRSLQIKGWVASGSTAALAFSFSSEPHLAHFVPIAVGVIVLVIWYLEAQWKLFQYAFTDRIRMIEAYFRNDPDILIPTLEPFQIYHWWFRTQKDDSPIFPYESANGKRPKSYAYRLGKVAFHGFVCLPYLPILVLCVISYKLL